MSHPVSTSHIPSPAPTQAATERPAGGLDPRGPRFAAALTSVALASVLLVPTPASIIVLTVVVAAFAQGALRGVQATPQAWVFRTFVRPRLAPTSDWEAPEPPRFAQAVGLGFTLIGLYALLAGLTVPGVTVVGQIAVGAALAAALLNAAFGFCLGCEIFAIRRRLLSHPVPSTLHR